MADTTVLYEVRDAVATITLNRPEAYNALNLTLARDLFQAVLEADEDPAVRCIVVTGAGKAFCAGGDVKDFADNPQSIGILVKELTTYLHGAVSRLARLAAQRIAAGALNGRSVADLARDLGVSERHLRRALERDGVRSAGRAAAAAAMPARAVVRCHPSWHLGLHCARGADRARGDGARLYRGLRRRGDGGGDRVKVLAESQLEARHLDDHRVVIPAHMIGQRRADVSRRRGIDA